MNKEYAYLFNTITDVVKSLEDLKEKLIEAQKKAEELYIEKSDE